MAPARAGHALTVLGPVAAAALGVTLPHEHLLLDLRFMFREPEPASARGRAGAPLDLAAHYATAGTPGWPRRLV